MNYMIRMIYIPYKIFNKIYKNILLKYYRMKGAEIGENTYIGPNVYIDVNHKPGKIIIGKNCYITRNCSLLAHSDAYMGGPKGIYEKFEIGKRVFGNIEIGNNVFI